MKKLVFAATIIFLVGCEPMDYDDCILKNMKDAKDETAARLIMQSCLDKYDKPPLKEKCALRELTEFEKLKVQIVNKGGLQGSSRPYLEFAMYNGNDRLRLKELKIMVTASNFPAPQVYLDRHLSILSDGVGPLKGEKVLVSVADLPTSKWSYEILSIQGCDE